jgi:hypothetical protein
MNAKQVLNKIIATLSLSKEEVTLAYAKLADGTILESPTFDVGEDVAVVSEDGTKSAAPNGEHEIVLKDSEGNEVRIKVTTEEGKIVDRADVGDEPTEQKSDEVPVEKLPEDMESIAGEDIGGESTDEEDETAEPITEDMGKVMEKLQYRIDEMEKKIQSMQDGMYPKQEEDVQMSDEEEELPKLDGAPIEENPSAKPTKNKFSKKVEASSQNSFLSRLYK